MKFLKVLCICCFSLPAFGDSFKLSSQDITGGEMMSSSQEFTGFGCDGGNLSPHLSWSGAPEGTKSFALTAYDPDAPTGSGWWHWQIVNIPLDVTEIARGAGNIDLDLAPLGSIQIENDFGFQGFGGACPPEGDDAHRYQFTLHALPFEHLDVKAQYSGALVGYMINSNELGSSEIEALYKR